MSEVPLTIRGEQRTYGHRHAWPVAPPCHAEMKAAHLRRHMVRVDTERRSVAAARIVRERHGEGRERDAVAAATSKRVGEAGIHPLVAAGAAVLRDRVDDGALHRRPVSDRAAHVGEHRAVRREGAIAFARVGHALLVDAIEPAETDQRLAQRGPTRDDISLRRPQQRGTLRARGRAPRRDRIGRARLRGRRTEREEDPAMDDHRKGDPDHDGPAR